MTSVRYIRNDEETISESIAAALADPSAVRDVARARGMTQLFKLWVCHFEEIAGNVGVPCQSLINLCLRD